MKLRRKIYIKVNKGYFLSRLVGGNDDQRFDCDALNHPRTLAGNWKDLEVAISEIILEYCGSIGRVIKPILLIHLIPKFDGGYTTSELAIFKQVGENAGAHICLMCDDKYGPLKNEELRDVFDVW
ncbi:MAG: hypothetical protein OEZ58_14965 [Gammaproteobacteria bacterium]|nr:hypothetical protein [Gammaproteobacteria bacterium]